MLQTYQYDLAGNLLRLEETGGTGELPSRVLECSYDGANRLATESDTRGSDPPIATSYGYDLADNRVSRVITGGPEGGTTSYAIGADNELASLTRPDSSVVSYGYDATGARVSRMEDGRTDSYAYDIWDRLLSLGLQTPADPALRGSYDYSYDARTRRMWRQELGEGTVLSFIGGVSVQEYGVGSVSTPPAPPSGAPTVEYVRGPDMGGGVGGLLYSVRSSSASLVHSSARGDVIERRAEDGTVNWQAQYEAFGKHPVESGSNPDRQRANSKEEDPTGLLNEGFRYRDLETGSFITRDPIGFKDGPNLHTYVHQNPWTHFDPEGLEDKDGNKIRAQQQAQAGDDRVQLRPKDNYKVTWVESSAKRTLVKGLANDAGSATYHSQKYADAQREYGGLIIRDPKTGKIARTEITGGGKEGWDGVSLQKKYEAMGYKVVADLHSHPNLDSADNYFSWKDVHKIAESKIVPTYQEAYLAAPSGIIRMTTQQKAERSLEHQAKMGNKTFNDRAEALKSEAKTPYLLDGRGKSGMRPVAIPNTKMSDVYDRWKDET